MNYDDEIAFHEACAVREEQEKIKTIIINCPKCNRQTRVKDHGRWIGWYCLVCKLGGSISKVPRKY